MPIHATEELDRLQRLIDRPGTEPYNILNELEGFVYFEDIPKKSATDFVDWNKTTIMKDLLGMINATFDYDIAPYVKLLRRLGAEWRELDILEQSIAKGHLRETDYNDYRTRFVADHEDDIVNAFKQNVLRGINRLSFYSIKVDEIPYVEDILEDNKEQLMKLLLTYLREGDMTDYGTAKGIVVKLLNADVKWTELEIILNSILKAFKEHYGED